MAPRVPPRPLRARPRRSVFARTSPRLRGDALRSDHALCAFTQGRTEQNRDTDRVSLFPPFPNLRDGTLAKPNYSFEKRQREIAKKKQQDEKQAKKQAAREAAKPADAGREPPHSK